jgi:flagellar biosynthesis protein FlhF
LVLIDTAGVGPSDVRLGDQIECLQNCSPFAKNLLVLSCTAQLLSLEDTVNAYQPLGIHGCVVTKIDEAMSLGPVLSTLYQSRLPIGFGTAGQRVPEDLSGLRSTALINKALSIAKASRPSVPDAAAELAFGGRIAHAS